MERLALPQMKLRPTVMKGGLDLVTPTLSLGAGFCVDALNFECGVAGGYTRIKGYERVDGRAAPSAAVYSIISINGFINTPSVGDAIDQVTSAATAVVAAIGPSYLVVTKVTGTFDTTNLVQITAGTVPIGIANANIVQVTPKQRALYQNAAADIYRALIGSVGGASCSGSVLGVFNFNDVWYAFRNNAAGTAATLWKSSAGGWTAVPLLNEVSFTAGAVATPVDGATLTQGANTATVRRVVTQSGAWTGTAAGRFIITTPAPGNFAAGAATLSGGATVTLSGVQTAITLAPNGKYETVTGNFFGQAGTIRVYGASGVDRAFEFDGTYYVPLSSGLTSGDTPKHIEIHNTRLFLSKDSSMFYSEAGEPYQFATGGEIAAGDTITGLLSMTGTQTGSALAVGCRNNIFMLYGTAAQSTWNFAIYSHGIGSFDYTMQNASTLFTFDDRGIVSMQTTLNFGNFLQATLTDKIIPFIQRERTKVVCSTLNREKNQYRLFFNDGYGLYLTLVNGRMIGVMPVLFPNIPNCAFEGELSTGDTISAFGATDGYVYQLERGTSFDGANLTAMLVLNYDNAGTPRNLKGYKHVAIEARSDYYVEFQMGYELAYGSARKLPASLQLSQNDFAGWTRWDNFSWDDFYWDGRSLLPSVLGLRGSGENIQYAFFSSGDYIDEFTINSLITHYTLRRALR